MPMSNRYSDTELGVLEQVASDSIHETEKSPMIPVSSQTTYQCPKQNMVGDNGLEPLTFTV